MAVASLVLGILGTVIGLIPLLAFIAIILGLLAVIFGPIGIGRARRVGYGKGMAIAGLILGIVALALAIYGFFVLNEAATELDRILQEV